MSDLREKINVVIQCLLDKIEGKMKLQEHLTEPDTVISLLSDVEDLWSYIKEDDREFIGAVRYAVRTKTRWDQVNIRKKSLKTSCGKFIDIYDNVFMFREQEFFENFFMDSYYQYKKAASSYSTSHLPTTFLHSRYKEDDVNRLNFFYPENIKKILDSYGELEFSTAWVNLSLPGTYCQKHSDIGSQFGTEQLTIMYYGTTTWQDSFGGETFFYNENGEKEIVVDYIPGRVVIFDSSIPHKPAFSYGHEVGRYVFVCLMYRDKNES